MKKKIKKLLKKDVIYTGFNQLWRLISGPLSLLFIPLYLNINEQGYWYTFGSIAALAVFADLGFTTIVSQFAAHEFTELKFSKRNMLVGSKIKLRKLSSFFIFTIKWSLVVSLIAFPIILVSGIFIFKSKNDSVIWELPWIVYMVGSAVVFVSNAIFSFLEGIGEIAYIQRTKLIIAIIYTTISILGLYFRIELYALAFALLISALVGILWLIYSYKSLFIQLSINAKNYSYSWYKEFLSLLWKYAISWGSGYLIFSIYTPLMFMFKGAEEAGKVGITLSLWMAISGLSGVWLYTIFPKLNMYASKEEYSLMKKEIKESFIKTFFTFGLGCISLVILVILCRSNTSLIHRFMGAKSMIIIGLCKALQIVVEHLAAYLRAFKEEPFVLMSVFTGLYTVVVTFFCAKFLHEELYFLGLLTSYTFVIPWAFYYYKKKIISIRER